jgi:hypothetical protein
MRAVFVNHLHPDAPHIGSVRLRSLAEGMAARGHQVVLLTESPRPDDPPPASVEAMLAAHDWSKPLVLGCPPVRSATLEGLRAGTLPRPARMAVIAWLYLVHGGVFPDWHNGTRPVWKVLAKTFRPQVTLGTFGNTEAWLIARGIARLGGCPWVMDIKDSWRAFIPAPFHRLLSRRFSDAAAMTTLSASHLEAAEKLFPVPGTVVHSGFPHELAWTYPSGPGFRLLVTGGLYGLGEAMVAGAVDWLERLPEAERAQVVFTYAGTEHESMAASAARLARLCPVEIHPFLPLKRLAELQREAFLNLYAKSTAGPDWFHHKVFELLCAGRPMASIPAEGDEAVRIAAQVHGELGSCNGPRRLAELCTAAWARRDRPVEVDRVKLAAYSWEGQAEVLERVLAGVVT